MVGECMVHLLDRQAGLCIFVARTVRDHFGDGAVFLVQYLPGTSPLLSRGSLSFEVWLALFDKGARTFFGILGGKNATRDSSRNIHQILACGGP
jgi:hypothetical protein